MDDRIFKVTFKDGEVFNGGTLDAPRWNKCPQNKEIESLEIFLPNEKDKIKLDGYERYNFFIGARKTINSNQISICHMYGLGVRRGIVTSYRITIKSQGNEKYKTGDITVRKFPFGKEGIGRTATVGWR